MKTLHGPYSVRCLVSNIYASQVLHAFQKDAMFNLLGHQSAEVLCSRWLRFGFALVYVIFLICQTIQHLLY